MRVKWLGLLKTEIRYVKKISPTGYNGEATLFFGWNGLKCHNGRHFREFNWD